MRWHIVHKQGCGFLSRMTLLASLSCLRHVACNVACDSNAATAMPKLQTGSLAHHLHSLEVLDERSKTDVVHAIGIQQLAQVICVLIGLEAIAQGPDVFSRHEAATAPV
eukprot:Skav229066  [mRNA]  locus=scaffold2611:277178:283013:+ [translate_table: standard]